MPTAAVSIPDGVNEIFRWIFPSYRTLVLRSTRPLIEMPMVMVVCCRYVGLSSHFHVPIV